MSAEELIERVRERGIPVNIRFGTSDETAEYLQGLASEEHDMEGESEK